MTHLHTLGWTANNGAQLFAVGWLGGLVSDFITGVGGWVAVAASTAWKVCFTSTNWKTDLDLGASWDADNCCK